MNPFQLPNGAGAVIAPDGTVHASDDAIRQMREAQRIAMIEGYRQAVAMHAMIPLAAQLDPDCTDKELALIARKARRAADALAREIFGEEALS